MLKLIANAARVEIIRKELVAIIKSKPDEHLLMSAASCLRTMTHYYKPELDQDKNCYCGHSYHRHYDWGEGPPYPISCKYCGCNNFQAKKE